MFYSFFKKFSIFFLIFILFFSPIFANEEKPKEPEKDKKQENNNSVVGNALSGAYNELTGQTENNSDKNATTRDKVIDNAVSGLATGVAACYAAGKAIAAAESAVATALTVPTHDAATNSSASSNTAKNCYLDVFANTAKRILVRALVDSVIEWINNGYRGKPSFGINLKNVVKDAYYSAVDDIIYGAGLGEICEDFNLPLKFAVSLYLSVPGGKSKRKCVLEDIKKNYEKEVKDLKRFYSMNKFLEINVRTSGSPFNIYYDVSRDLKKAAAAADENVKEELRNNRGFISFRKCNETYNKWWEEMKKKKVPGYEGPPVYNGSDMAKENCSVVTPGSVLSDKLNASMKSDLDEIITADEFDEIIGAIVKDLMKRLTSNENGVAGFNNGTERYFSVKDPALQSSRDSVVSLFNKKIFDLALKIKRSQERTVNNAYDYYDEVEYCWEGLADRVSFGEVVYKKVRLPDNLILEKTVELSDSSLNQAMDLLEDNYKEVLDIEKKIVEREIQKLEIDKNKIDSILVQINEAETSGEITNILLSNDIDQININSLVSDKRRTEEKINEVINGKLKGFDSNGKEIREGGLVVLKNYCLSFNLSEPTTTFQADESDEGVDLARLRNEKFVNVIDSYDPSDDIYFYNKGYDLSEFDYINEEESGNLGNDGPNIENNENFVCEESDNRICLGRINIKTFSENNFNLEAGKEYIYTVEEEDRVSELRSEFYTRNLTDGDIDIILTRNPDRVDEAEYAPLGCRLSIGSNTEKTMYYNIVDEFEVYSTGCNIGPEGNYYLYIKGNGNGEVRVQGVGLEDFVL